EGRVGSAAARLQAGAEAMAAESRTLREVTLLHDLVRLGHVRHVEHRLTTVARTTTCELVRLMASHGRAADAATANDLLAVSDAWETAGFLLFAAEAAAQAAGCASRGGDRSTAARASAVSRALAAQCPGAATP